MTITLQVNSSEKNKIGKSLATVLELTGTLRSECSVMNPTIRIEADLADLTGVNYMTIDEFDRSYFVTDMRSIANGLVEISGHVDVLETYKDEILANTAIIARQENSFNLYVDDGVFRAYQNQQVVMKQFSGTGFTDPKYVLAIAGR